MNAKGASTFATAPVGPRPVVLSPARTAPTGLSLKPLDTGVLLSLTAPANMGTGTLTGYQVLVTDTVTSATYLYSVTSLPSTLLGLPNDDLVSVEAKTVTTDGISGGSTGFADDPRSTPRPRRRQTPPQRLW